MYNYNIISYHIIPEGIISYYVISYHIISCILSYPKELKFKKVAKEVVNGRSLRNCVIYKFSNL